MKRHYPYLIVGGGMAADAAVRGIRQVDSEHSIGLIGDEPDPPYNRPPLSKGLWKTGPRPMPLSRIWRGTANLGVDLILGRTVTQLNPVEKTVIDDQQNEYSFDRLLLATGGKPIQLGVEHERVVYFRTLADYHKLRRLTENYHRFAVIGGGFIGSELAAALAGLDKEITMVFPEPGIGARVLPSELSTYMNSYFREKGIRILAGHLVQAVEPSETGVTLRTNLGDELQVDGVVAGLGIRPNIDLAKNAGLETGNGILVDPNLRTNHPDIYAAGDVANFYATLLNKRMRVEHEENANLTGQTAGQNMAGQPATYDQLPSVYSTIFDISYDAVGELNPEMTIIYDWQEPYRKGCAYYMHDGRVWGVLLWNRTHGLDKARHLIARAGAIHPDDLIGAISETG